MMLAAPLRIRYVHGLILNSSTASQNLAPNQTPFPFTFYQICEKSSPQNATTLQHVKWSTCEVAN